MKNKKTILLLSFFIVITIIFFTYQTIITYDSSHYLWLTSLMTKDGDFSTWDVARGPIFPLFIRISQIIFGTYNKSLLVGMFIFYLIMLFFSYRIYKEIIEKDKNSSAKIKNAIIILFILLVAINPMIIGYYHTLLTEFIAITFSVIGCYLSWKWMQINFEENKKIYIIYTIILAVLTAVAWQLKQPYVGTILFPIIIAGIISFIRKISIKNLVQRGITILVCIIILIISMKSWSAILEINNVQIEQERTSAGFFASGILGGLKQYEVKNEFDTIEKIQLSTKIKEEDKEKMKQILENNSEYESFMVIDKHQEKYEIIYLKGQVISTAEATKFLLSSLLNDYKSVLGGYIRNYFATISISPYDFNNNGDTQLKVDFKNTQEISAIGFRIYEYEISTTFPLDEKYQIYANSYSETTMPLKMINGVLKKLRLPSSFIMKISYTALPILTICSIIAVFKTKKKYDEKYVKMIDMITILYSFSFAHILMHALLGATIDRYTMPALVTTFIAILLSIYAVIYRKKYKTEK